MRKTYEFYEREFGISNFELTRILNILKNVENDIYNEKEIRSLGEKGLKVCLSEGKFELFKKLVSPFEYNENNVVCYKYLLDAFSLGMVEFIERCPSSIMEHWVLFNKNEMVLAEREVRKFETIPVEYTSKEAIVLYPSLKKELLDAIYKVDVNKVMDIRIKDVLARQICGLCNPIYSSRDVIYYSESPCLFANLALFKKNIMTTYNDTENCFDDGDYLKNDYGKIEIGIHYDSLDEVNKVVAQSLIDSGHARVIEKSMHSQHTELRISVVCNKNDKVKKANAKLMELVSKFYVQEPLFGLLSYEDFYDVFSHEYSFLTEDEIKTINGILEKGWNSENILEAVKLMPNLCFSFYYDSDTDRFWMSKAYYERNRAYLEKKLVEGKKV